MIDYVYPPNIVSEVRFHLSSLPVSLLRERLVQLLYVITDLASLPSSISVADTPLSGIMPRLVLDLLYGGTFKREGIW